MFFGLKWTDGVFSEPSTPSPLFCVPLLFHLPPRFVVLIFQDPSQWVSADSYRRGWTPSKVRLSNRKTSFSQVLDFFDYEPLSKGRL